CTDKPSKTIWTWKPCSGNLNARLIRLKNSFTHIKKRMGEEPSILITTLWQELYDTAGLLDN
ncbi:hypothetical protein, partial [Sphingobacterium sp. UBA6308]